MKVAILFESDRITVSNLDLDDNAFIFSMKGAKEPNNSYLEAYVYINGLNAYVGDIINSIRYERPSISIASDIFKNFGNPDYQYVDPNGRKWNATLLTAILIKRVIQKIEEVVTKRVKEISVSISPTLKANEVQRELKTSLSYFNVELVNNYTHAASLIAYLYDKKLFRYGHVLHVHLDYFDSYIQVLKTERDITYQMALSSINNVSKKEAILYLKNKIILSIKEDSLEFDENNMKNMVTLDDLSKDVYKNFFISSNKEYSKAIFFNGKPANISINEHNIKSFKSDIENELRSHIIKTLDSLEIPYDLIDHIVISGVYSECLFIENSIIKLFENWVEKHVKGQNILAKGSAICAFKNIEITNIKKYQKEESTTFEQKSAIRLKVDSSEEYIVFDSDSNIKYTSLTINLTPFEKYFTSHNVLEFEHYIIKNNATNNVADLIIPFDGDHFPSQLQLNIMRSGDIFNSNIQAIDIENDRILTVEYRIISEKLEIKNNEKEETPKISIGSLQPKITIGTKQQSKVTIGDVKSSKAVMEHPNTTYLEKAKDIGVKPKIHIPLKVDKVKIEVNKDEVKDKFQDFIEIVIINNTK
jgi:hypothetical protein